MLLCCGAWQYRTVNVRVTVIQYYSCCAVGPGNIGLLMLESLLQTCYCAVGPGNKRLLMLESLYYSCCAGGPGNIGLLMLESLYYSC